MSFCSSLARSRRTLREFHPLTTKLGRYAKGHAVELRVDTADTSTAPLQHCLSVVSPPRRLSGSSRSSTRTPHRHSPWSACIISFIPAHYRTVCPYQHPRKRRPLLEYHSARDAWIMYHWISYNLDIKVLRQPDRHRDWLSFDTRRVDARGMCSSDPFVGRHCSS